MQAEMLKNIMVSGSSGGEEALYIPLLILLFAAKALFLAIVIYYSVYYFEKKNEANNWTTSIILGALINFAASIGIILIFLAGYLLFANYYRLSFGRSILLTAVLNFALYFSGFIFLPILLVFLILIACSRIFAPKATALKVADIPPQKNPYLDF